MYMDVYIRRVKSIVRVTLTIKGVGDSLLNVDLGVINLNAGNY